MAPEPKKRKIDPPVSRRPVSSPAAKRTRDATSTGLKVQLPQPSLPDNSIQQAKNFAVAQAQQDGCTGNFRIFDSPFGNYLVPVIPTRAELSG